MYIISACLAGVNCRYDGDSNLKEQVMKLVQEGKAVLVCPEQLGGLSTPRLPAEIIHGDGEDVLEKKAKVVNREGEDVTQPFVKGAEETLKIARACGAKCAILKAKSPSCGKGKIYDGTFRGKLMTGDGVTTALLKQHGIKVIDENEIE